MNSLEKQLKEEKHVLEVFLSVNPIKGEILKKKLDQIPDVLIEIENSIIGIEITEIKNKQPTIEGRQREIAKSIQSKLIFNFDGVLDINIVFPTIAITKKGKVDIETRIIKLIETNIFSDNKSHNHYHFEVDNGYDNIISVYIFKYIKELKSDKTARIHVHCVEAGWQNTFPEPMIEKIINQKNKRYSEYIQNCTECWLLIFANPINKEGHFDFSNIKTSGYKSLFKKTFIIDLFKPQELIEVN